ncbi:MAG: class I SAM-dependent methyltransferase [Prolixibacteraceae bacterium]|jgi:SAM-dependent methyltransferase|nr:class I SAM-dependent methyltransferase [Prolixibacteraceae bacterium]
MENVCCNLCGLDDTVLWGNKAGIDIVKCRNCGLIYCNPRPDNSELQKFYSEEYFIEGHYEEDFLRQRMYEIEIDEIVKRIGRQGRFLDVGCAVGKFLQTLPDTFEKWGTEFSEDAARMGRDKFNLNIISGQVRDAPLPLNYFDVVQMRGVLEHSQNPYEDLTKIRMVLKDSGLLRISQLPNIGGISARLFKTRFNQVKPGEHLYYFTPKTLKLMLDKTGFRIVSIDYPYLNTPYASLIKDIFSMFACFFNNKTTPPFFRNMMIVYADKKEK